MTLRTITVGLAFAFAFAFSGCNSGDPDSGDPKTEKKPEPAPVESTASKAESEKNIEKSAIIGKWIIREAAGVKAVSDKNWYQFMDDGKAVQSTIGVTSAATWKLVGDALTVTALADPNDPEDFDLPLTYVIKSIENGRMVLTLGGADAAVLEKGPAATASPVKTPAIAAFTKELADRGFLKDFGEMEELTAKAEEDPAPLFEAMVALNEKLKPLDTSGLPEDLKEAFGSLRSGIRDVAVQIKAMPLPMEVLKGGEAAIAAWAGEKATADPEFFGKFQVDMAAWQKEMETLGSQDMVDDEVFEKYGIFWKEPGSTPSKAGTPTSPEGSGKPKVTFETSAGTIVLELDPENAPITTGNFLSYVNEGFYDGTIFHRVIGTFMIQGGGFALVEGKGTEKRTKAPIRNEAKNGLKNTQGAISMARTNDPDSATSQFFINVVDNPSLDPKTAENPDGFSPDGYAVFGRVIEGMDVVDKIKQVDTGVKRLRARTPADQLIEQPMQDVPLQNVVIKKATASQ